MSWVLVVGLIVCALSLLPAIFDHGERKKAFKLAVTKKEKWETGLKWIAINWGLPLLTILWAAGQAIESKSTDSEIKNLKLALSRSVGRTLSDEQKKVFSQLIATLPKTQISFSVDPLAADGGHVANELWSVFKAAGWKLGRVGEGTRIGSRVGIEVRGNELDASTMVAIGAALNSVGWDGHVATNTNPIYVKMFTNNITVFIGRRPQE